MNGVLERTLGVLELLSQHGSGLELATVADRLNIPRSAAHRLLNDLIRCGYVRQAREHGDYLLTTKLISIGLSYLSSSGIVDIAQPLLNRLAEVSGELVRLSVVDGGRLTWVARAQGARQGLRYDAEMGSDAQLSCSASGWAWMASMPDDQALALVAQQGLAGAQEFGPNAPSSMKALLKRIHETRAQGFSLTEETFTAGLNAMAAPVGLLGQPALGVLSIAGPSVRLTKNRMQQLAPDMLNFASQLAAASSASPFFVSTGVVGKSSALSGRRPIYAD
jgi:IclR family transcriptional regulator, acetate operon repressor